ncbi:uncharacterized protein LOC143078537 [Mytilus galloprovincialis]|uniref:uncharacterized protein LOC143078537 n=1 Tax=Mytilus galloprovincialis TaxID=29158 RepID=UPI003F7BDDED
MASLLLLHILITTVVKLTIAQTVTLSPGPTVTVLVNSPVTFSCTTTYSMRFLFIRDSTKPAGTTAVTLGNLKGVCSTLSLDSDYVVNCDTVIGPYNFTIKSVTTKYHNSNITCTVQYGSSTSIDIASAVTTILVKDFQLTTSSRRATTGVNFSFTYSTDQTFVAFNKDDGPYCVVNGVQDGTCKLDSSCSSNNMYSCNITTGTYTFTIPGAFVTDSLHNSKWNCQSPFGIGNPSNNFEMYVRISVKTITITPAGTNDQLNGEEGQTQTFTCTTSPYRPAAWIQWYIGTQNLTTQSAIHISEQAGNTFISSSTLTYTWMSADHNKSMYCEPINFKEAQLVTSTKILIYIHSKY